MVYRLNATFYFLIIFSILKYTALIVSQQFSVFFKIFYYTEILFKTYLFLLHCFGDFNNTHQLMKSNDIVIRYKK